MNNLVVLPILIPLLTAILLILFLRRIQVQRWISGCSAVLHIGASFWLAGEVAATGIQTLYMGGWLPPYGIVLVADMLAALLVLVASIVAAACTFYAFRSINVDREKHHFYPLFQFLIAGVCGSFLTGDLFNLFVCFELMLMASYALIVLGGTKRQMRETIKYILINIVSSSLFVTAVAYLYAVTGTLNMAHLSVRVAEVGQYGIVMVIATLFLIVFSIKAGLFLFFWLSGPYAAPPAVVAALFAGLLTKVGLYAIVRTFMLIFYHDPELTHNIIGYMAAATMILGVAGAVAYRDVNKILVYNVIAGVGFIAFGMAAANETALEGVVFYMMHDMIVKTLLFLLGGMIVALAESSRLDRMSGLMKQSPTLGWMFFVSGLALAGIPPLSGFIGKMKLFRGGLEAELYVITGIGVLTSLLMLYSMMKIFMKAFWGPEQPIAEYSRRRLRGLVLPAASLFILVIAIGLGAEGLTPFVERAVDVLMEPSLYIDAVLKE